MTAVEWLMQTLEQNNIIDLDLVDSDKYYAIIEQAKKMERQQIMDAFDEGQEYEYQYHINNAPKFYSETYFAETYGSKGSDEIKKAEEMGLYDKIELANPNDNIFTSSQTEISDEEIEKEATKYVFINGRYSFKQAIKWYREQLKKK